MSCIAMLPHDTIILGIDGREGIALRTVLLVLQSESFCFAMQEALKEYYHVTVAQDTVSGAALLQAQPDILMLDLFLPGTNGFCFLEENRYLLPPIVLLFTTFIDSSILHTASDLGVAAFFIKPCSISAVSKQLERL